MIIRQLKLKLTGYYKLFIAPRKIWRRPNKSDVLIYDACGAQSFFPYLTGYTVELLRLRGETINIHCLLRALFKIDFWKGKLMQAYKDVYIELVAPLVIMTFIDNDPGFYSISNRFPLIKTIFFQNGLRLADFFQALHNSENYRVDYMLVFGRSIGEYYNRFIAGKVITDGSLKNNAVKKADINTEKRSIVFISQYRDKPLHNEPFYISNKGGSLFWSQFYDAEAKVLSFLGEWCSENNNALRICGVQTKYDKSEKEYFDDVLKDYMWDYIPKDDLYGSYKVIDSAEIVISIDSSLGYESLARGKKTAIYSCRGAAIDSDTRKFGWPACLPDKGPFWSNEADDKEFRRIIDYLNSVSSEEWEQCRQLYTNDLIEFDPENSRFVALLEQLLPKSVNSNHAF